MNPKILAIINFVYFLANFPGSFFDTVDQVWKDEPVLASHLKSKLPAAPHFTPGDIISWFFQLSESNKHTFAEWVEKNYHYSDTHRN